MVDGTYQVLVDIDATAAEGASVYVGQAGMDPQLNPIPLFWDAALTIPAAQPLRTSGGYIVRNGTPADFYASSSNYSVRLRNSAGRSVWTVMSAGGTNPASRVLLPIPGGPPGKDGSPPATVTYFADAGQRRFPPAPFTLNNPPPGYPAKVMSPTAAAVFLNTGFISNRDEENYTKETDEDGNLAAVTFTIDMLQDAEITITGYLAAGAEDGGTSPTPALDELSLSDFPRLAGETQDMPRFKRLKAAALASAKGQFWPAGQFYAGEAGKNADLSNTGFLYGDDIRVRGAGKNLTTINQVDGFPYMFYGDPPGVGTTANPSIVGPGDATESVNIAMSDMTLQDDPSKGFSEFMALIFAGAVKDVSFKRMMFKGWRGDAAQLSSCDLGSTPGAGPVAARHNLRILFEDCDFDGVLGNNRQAISVIDGVSVVRRNCRVQRATKGGNGNTTPLDPLDPNTGYGMPGADDCEANLQFTKTDSSGNPVEPYPVTLYDQVWDGWYVEDNGGSAIAWFLGTGNNPNQVTNPLRGFYATRVTAIRCKRGILQVFGAEQAVIPFDGVLENSVAIDCFRPFELLRFRGLTWRNIEFRGCFNSGFVGYAGNSLRDWTAENIRFYRCGLNDGLVMALEGGDRITWDRWTFENCNGTAVAIRGSAKLSNFRAPNIRFYNSGASGAPSLINSFTVVRNADSSGTPTETLDQAINRLVDARTFELPGAVFNGVARPNFPYLNGQYPSPPTTNEWLPGDRVYCSPAEDGAPVYWEAYAANTLPAPPRWKAVGQQGYGSDDPVAAPIDNVGTVGTTSGVIRGANNRFTAKLSDQRVWIAVPFSLAPSGAGIEIVIRTPYSRTANDFFGLMRRTSAPSDFAADFATTTLDNFSGIWTDGGPLGTKSMQQSDDGNNQRQMLSPWLYGQEWKIWFKSNSVRPELKVAKKVNGVFVQQGQTIQLDSQAANGDLYYPFFQLGSASDSFQILSIAAAGGFPQ